MLPPESINLTWRNATGVIGLTHIVGEYETVEMTFVVRREGEEAVLGLGHLLKLSP